MTSRTQNAAVKNPLSGLTVILERHGEVRTLVLAGRFEMPYGEVFEEAVEQLSATRPKRLVIALGGLTSIDTADYAPFRWPTNGAGPPISRSPS